MSNYNNQLSFLERTLSLLADLESKTGYEKTLFLNTCLGLLVAPQQWDNRAEHKITGEMNETDWYIDTHTANPNTPPKDGESPYSVEAFANHLRNCLCHHLFEVLGDSESITSINVLDYANAQRTDCTFALVVSFDALKQFVIKYAKAKKSLLESNP